MNDEIDVDLQNAVSEAAQVLLRIFRFASNAFSAWEHFEMYDEAIESATESQAAIEKYRTLTIWEDLSPLNFTLLELNIWSLYDRLGQFIRELRERDEDLLLDRGGLSSAEEILVIRRFYSVLKNRYAFSNSPRSKSEIKETIRRELTDQALMLFNFLIDRKQYTLYQTLRDNYKVSGLRGPDNQDSSVWRALARLEESLLGHPILMDNDGKLKKCKLSIIHESI